MKILPRLLHTHPATWVSIAYAAAVAFAIVVLDELPKTFKATDK